MLRRALCSGRLLFSAALATLLGGCPDREGAARSEAALVSQAVDALRDADNAAKAARLAALRAVTCGVEDVCAVRSTCISAYELHVRALDGLGAARAAVADGGAERAAVTLEAARGDLDRARSLTERCTTVEGEMVRKYGVR